MDQMCVFLRLFMFYSRTLIHVEQTLNFGAVFRLLFEHNSI